MTEHDAFFLKENGGFGRPVTTQEFSYKPFVQTPISSRSPGSHNHTHGADLKSQGVDLVGTVQHRGDT
jgi:hypothetical protein